MASSSEKQTPRVFGLLGGIASGKSAVARLLAGELGLVIAADDLAHQALASPEVVEQVAATFGPDALGPDGLPDRAILAERIFSAPLLRERLESWIHPLVRDRILELLQEAAEAGRPRVALDVPLLLENDDTHGLVSRCDHLIFVDAPLATREARAQASRGWSRGEVSRREAAQLPLEEKRRRADYTVANEGSLDELEGEVRRVLGAVGLQ